MLREHMRKAVAYYRVSTKRQGKSRLGLEAQQDSVKVYKELTGTEIIKEYFEVETGRENNRPKLKRAIRYCEKENCFLLIPKIDRLARNAFFVANLLEGKTKIVAADKPLADRLDLLEDAIKAQRGAEEIRQNTRKALQAAKRKGTKLGKNGKKLAKQNKRLADAFARKMIPVIEKLRSEGFNSNRKLCKELRRRRIATFRSGCKWHSSTVHGLLERIKLLTNGAKDT